VISYGTVKGKIQTQFSGKHGFQKHRIFTALIDNMYEEDGDTYI
jgi:hypothetical protein